MPRTRYNGADADYVTDDPTGPCVLFHAQEGDAIQDIDISRHGVYITGQIMDRDNWHPIDTLPVYISMEQLQQALAWLEDQDA